MTSSHTEPATKFASSIGVALPRSVRETSDWYYSTDTHASTLRSQNEKLSTAGVAQEKVPQEKVPFSRQPAAYYFKGVRCASPDQYKECGIPLDHTTTTGRYHDPCDESIEPHGSATLIAYNYGSKSHPEWFEFKALPKRLAGPSGQEPPGSDRAGVRRALAAARLNAALGTNFLPLTAFCLDPHGRLGLGVRSLNYCEIEEALPWMSEPADLQTVEDCACFLALLGYSDGPSRIHIEMNRETRAFVRDEAGKLHAFSQRNFDAFRGIRGHFPEGPVIDEGKGNGFTIATLSPSFRRSLLDMTPYRLRLTLGNLVTESVILMTMLTLKELQAGIRTLDKPDKKSTIEHNKVSCCAIL